MPVCISLMVRSIQWVVLENIHIHTKGSILEFQGQGVVLRTGISKAWGMFRPGIPRARGRGGGGEGVGGDQFYITRAKK